MRQAGVEENSGYAAASKCTNLVEFGQISGHDGEVGGRLSDILDSLYKEPVDHLAGRDRLRTFPWHRKRCTAL